MASSYLRNDAVSAITYPSNNAGGTGEQVTYVYDTATGEPSGMFAHLVDTYGGVELDRVHRFSHH